MIGQTRLLSTLATLVKRSRADAISVCAHPTTRNVCRFAYEAIHQNLVQEDVDVVVKVIRGRRVGVASADTLDPRSLARCATAAMDIAAHSPVQKDLPELPSNHCVQTKADHAVVTTRVSPTTCVGTL